MSFRPVATRALDKKQFHRNMPPPIPNSTNVAFSEMPGWGDPRKGISSSRGETNVPDRDGGVGGISGRNDRLTRPQIGAPQNLHGRQTVFNFIDRQGVDTRYHSADDSRMSSGMSSGMSSMQMQKPYQTNIAAGEMLRPQNSRDTQVGYFNHEEEAPKILQSWGQGGGQGGGQPVTQVEVPRQGGDVNLMKYSQMYKTNNKFMN